MTEFTWIASFPKSGNTWCRYIVAQILFDFDMKTSRIDETIPDVNNWTGNLLHSFRGAYPVKTHLTYTALPKPMILRNAVYMVRHPLDVVVSTLGYMEPDGDANAVSGVIEELVNRGGTLESWLRLGFGTLAENVLSWCEARDSGQPVLIVRYEDLIGQPFEKVRQIAAFLGKEIDDRRCQEIVEATSFSSLRSLEEQQIAEGKNDMFLAEKSFKDDRDFRFMRAGTTGQYKTSLSADAIERLAPVFKPVLERFAYDL